MLRAFDEFVCPRLLTSTLTCACAVAGTSPAESAPASRRRAAAAARRMRPGRPGSDRADGDGDGSASAAQPLTIAERSGTPDSRAGNPRQPQAPTRSHATETVGASRPVRRHNCRLGSARLGSARLGSARLGSARLNYNIPISTPQAHHQTHPPQSNLTAADPRQSQKTPLRRHARATASLKLVNLEEFI